MSRSLKIENMDVQLSQCLKKKIPIPWQGLFRSGLSMDHSYHNMTVWFRKVNSSHVSNKGKLRWSDLLTCLCQLEPVPEENQAELLFLPVFFHLPRGLQTNLMTFIFHHRKDMQLTELATLVTQLRNLATSSSQKSQPDIIPTHDWLEYWLTKIEDFTSKAETDFGTDIPSKYPLQPKGIYEFSSDNSPSVCHILKKLSPSTSGKVDLHSEITNPLRLWWGGCDKEILALDNNAGTEADADIFSQATMHTSAYEMSHSLSTSFSTQDPSRKRIKLDESMPDSLSDTSVNLGHSLHETVIHVKEIWHQDTEQVTKTEDLIQLFCHSSIEELPKICGLLDMCDLHEARLCCVGTQIASLKELLPLTHAQVLVQHLLLNKVASMSVTASRFVQQACVTLLQAYPRAVSQALLLPLLTDNNTGVHQADLIHKLIKDSMSPEDKINLLREYFDGEVMLLGNSMIAVLQDMLDAKMILDDSILEQMISSICRSSPTYVKNLKYGKVILALVKGYDKQLKAELVGRLSQAVDGHQTFLKKAILSALKKIKN